MWYLISIEKKGILKLLSLTPVFGQENNKMQTSLEEPVDCNALWKEVKKKEAQGNLSKFENWFIIVKKKDKQDYPIINWVIYFVYFNCHGWQ